MLRPVRSGWFYVSGRSEVLFKLKKHKEFTVIVIGILFA